MSALYDIVYAVNEAMTSIVGRIVGRMFNIERKKPGVAGQSLFIVSLLSKSKVLSGSEVGMINRNSPHNLYA